MRLLIVLFFIALSTQLKAASLGDPDIQLHTRESTSGFTTLEATVGPLTNVAGIQFDILLPASLEDAVDISSCQANTQSLAVEDVLLSCYALTIGDFIRVRHIIASLTQQSLSGNIVLSTIKINNRKRSTTGSCRLGLLQPYLIHAQQPTPIKLEAKVSLLIAI